MTGSELKELRIEDMRPVRDNVILEKVQVEDQTVGGIILTGKATAKPSWYRVLAVGPGGLVARHEQDDGSVVDETVTMFVKPGDLVVVEKYKGTDIHLAENILDLHDLYTVVRQKDIIAVLTEDDASTTAATNS